jgi:hypothetical protein
MPRRHIQAALAADLVGPRRCVLKNPALAIFAWQIIREVSVKLRMPPQRLDDLLAGHFVKLLPSNVGNYFVTDCVPCMSGASKQQQQGYADKAGHR